jgi:hypothetical protein
MAILFSGDRQIRQDDSAQAWRDPDILAVLRDVGATHRPRFSDYLQRVALTEMTGESYSLREAIRAAVDKPPW